MRVTLERVISDVRALLPDDQERLRQWLHEQATRTERERQDQEKFAAAAEHAREIFQWLEENNSQYSGQWVALDGGRLVAHGTNAKEVYQQAKAAGVAAPLVHFLETEKFQRQAQLEEDQARQELTHYWLSENRAHYAGQWVALDGDRLIAASKNNAEFVAAVRASGVKVPFVTKIEEADELPFAGW